MKTEQLANKTYGVVIMKKPEDGRPIDITDIKKFEIMVPPYVIGVGVVQAIFDYMDDNKLRPEYELVSYSEIRG